MTFRALLVAAVLAFLAALAVQQIALVYNAGETESSVPPVPAVMALLVFAGINPLLRRVRRRLALGQGELLVIYAVLVLSVAMSGRRLVRILLAFITVPTYYRQFSEFAANLPSWYLVNDDRAARLFFESARDGRVPWGIWWQPLLAWSGFLLATWAGMFCLLNTFQKRWAEQEHLRFPLLYLPLELASQAAGVDAARRSFLRNGLMWIGFAVGFWYALPVVLSPIWPRMPDWKATLYPFQGLSGPPWGELSSIYFRPLPHLVGLGYLMSTDNLFSVWASFFAQKLSWVIASAYGIRHPAWHTPPEHEQAFGAIAAMAGWLLWGNRRALAASGSRLHLAVAAAGYVAGVWFIGAAGAPVWMGIFLMTLLYAGALVYARLRAETGLPSYWALPFLFQERDFMLQLFGTRSVLYSGGMKGLIAFSALGWLSTGQFPQTGAYHVENLRLARLSGTSQGAMLGVNLGALALGLGLAYWTHLRTFYNMGALSAVGAGGDGYYEAQWARGSYAKVLAVATSSAGVQWGPNLMRLAGGAVVIALSMLRGRFANFPITPWGYLVASSYGGTYWASFLITWALQKVILRYGGMKAHVKAVPLFLGVAFGYMTATVAAVSMGFATGKAFSFRTEKRLYFDI